MKITAIREMRVPLQGAPSNAVVNFGEHDVSLVAVVSDVFRHGRPVIGYAFNSIGRFAQGGLLRARFIPRLLAARPDQLLGEGGFDCRKVATIMMRNEKPGGHGDRAGAVAALELAFWDLNAKLADEPAYATIARRFGRTPAPHAAVYAAGGYYGADASPDRLRDELIGYRDQGFDAFKIKIGGAALAHDLARIEAALAVCEGGQALSVDANGRFAGESARIYARALAPYALRWLEEVGDPLDFALNAEVAAIYPGAIATGENLFSIQDVANLVRYGGMRPHRDVFQMDAGLSYGLTEFAAMIELLEAHGYDRAFCHPHGGHMINLHIVLGLNLGGCEAYPGVFQPFGGYSSECRVSDGRVAAGDAPGFGLEAKAALGPYLAEIAS